MTGSARSQILGVIGLVLAVLVFAPATTLALQEKISPVSDYQYSKKDFPQYEATVKKEADPLKRADLILAFMKEHPISKMLTTATTDYMECLKPVVEKKDWAKAISMEEAFLALIPTEKAVQDAQVPEPGAGEFIKTQLVPSRRSLMVAIMNAHFQANDMAKAAEMGEKIYALSPDKTMAAGLAEIYLKMQNYDKFLVFGDKIVAEVPIEQSYVTAWPMVQIYLQKSDIGKAKALCAKMVGAFGDKVPPGIQPNDWNTIRAVADPLSELTLPAAAAYAQKDYAKAVELYQKVAQADNKRDDAYYYIGMCKWRQQDPEGAIDAFAKTVVLGKANAAKAKQYLEDLYKARHNNTLDGLDQVLAKAKADLGLG